MRKEKDKWDGANTMTFNMDAVDEFHYYNRFITKDEAKKMYQAMIKEDNEAQCH